MLSVYFLSRFKNVYVVGRGQEKEKKQGEQTVSLCLIPFLCDIILYIYVALLLFRI